METNNKKMKLHCQLEPFNGVKFDFIEIEVQSIEEIKNAYAMLNELKPQTNAYEQAINKGVATKVASNNELAFNKQGKPVKTTDGFHMTKEQMNKALKAQALPWTLTKAQVESL